MTVRRNDYDVTNAVNTTQPGAVRGEVTRIYQDLYQRDAPAGLGRAFADLERLYRGVYPGFRACETGYHDIQHVLDVTLAMARLMSGCTRAGGARAIAEPLFRFGVVLALFHDCGYIRYRKDNTHRNGAEYTPVHVSRGARFLEDYLPRTGMAGLAHAAAGVLHFTGFEIPVAQIRVPAPEFRVLGKLVGSADILGQMSDSCYLEKCHDRLYPEFVLGGITRRRRPDGTEVVLFASPADLVYKTPAFYEGARRRLREELDGCYQLAERHFGGQNVYLDEMEKNVRHARLVAAEGDVSLLRRRPPAAAEATSLAVEPRERAAHHDTGLSGAVAP